MQRDGAAGAPDEIARMGGDDEPGLLIRHSKLLSRTGLLN